MIAIKRLAVNASGAVQYSQAEEYVHVVSHMVGVLLGIVSIFLTLQYCSDKIGLISGIVFSASLILLYTASCTYHGVPYKHLQVKRILQVIDHSSIFILIAGTGTPFILCAISTFSVPAAAFFNLLMWGCAAVGIILLTISIRRFKHLSIVLYLAMGFSVLAKASELKAVLGSAGFALLLAGGIVYCIGLVFYSIKVRWTHSVFHVLCIAGSMIHCICIMQYVI